MQVSGIWVQEPDGAMSDRQKQGNKKINNNHNNKTCTAPLLQEQPNVAVCVENSGVIWCC